MPVLLWMDLVSLGISLIVSAALAALALGVRSRRPINYAFIALILTEAAWATLAMFLRFSLLLEIGNPTRLLELTALALSLTGPLLLLFTTRYLGRPTRRLDAVVAVGIAAMALLCIPLFRHHLILNPRLAANGALFFDISPAGVLIALLPTLYMAGALALFWQERRRIEEPRMALSVLIMLVGLVAREIPSVPPWITTTMNTLGILLIGYTVISQQIFNPLKELTEELEQRVKDRTRELTRAAAQLTTIHSLGQNLVLSRDETEITHLVLDAARRMLHISTCDLWMVNREQGVLERQSDAATSSPPPVISLHDQNDVIASVARTGHSIHLPDAGQDTDDRNEAPRPCSALCVPLRIGSHMLGVLNVESCTPNGFTPADTQLVEALANSAAIAIRNARLYAETRHRTERLAVVNHIAQVAGSTLDVDDLMTSVYFEIAAAFHPDAFFIALYNDQTDELDFCFQVDEKSQYPPGQCPLGEELTSRIVAEKKPLLIRDLAEYQRERHPLLPMPFENGKTVTSWLGVPMLIEERVTGVISVQSYQPYKWDEKDKLLLLTIADQVAVALEKARLLQEQERRVTELAIVSEIGRTVSSTLEMDRVLETVHRQVGRLFDTTNFFIAAYEEAIQEWSIAFHVEQGQNQPIGRRYPLECGLTGYILRHRQHLLFRSSEEIFAFHQEHGGEIVGAMARSWLGVPLITADKIVGVMGIQNYEHENLYTEQDVALLSTVAAQIAPALYNLRLLEEARRRSKELEVINEVSQTITALPSHSTMQRMGVSRS